MHPFRLIVLCVALCLAACAPHHPPHDTSPKAKNFPVVVPFALDRAGSKATVEFELPNALDPYLPEPTLRPVFIGVRRVSKDGDLMTEEEFQESGRHLDYLQRESIPARLVLERWEQGQWRQAAMQAEHDNFLHGPGRVWYEHIAEDGIVPNLRPISPDYMELIGIGQYREDKAYATYQFARIVPPTPGRYRLQVESLQAHPAVRGLQFELLVSHEYHYGIR